MSGPSCSFCFHRFIERASSSTLASSFYSRTGMDTKESLQKLTDCLVEATKVLSVLVNNAEFRDDPSSGSARVAAVRPGLATATPLNRDNQSSGLALPSLRPTNTSTSTGQGRLLGEQTLRLPPTRAPLRLNQTLSRARNMVQLASSSGALRRLSQTERLRSAVPASVQTSSFLRAAKKPKLEQETARPFEFVLMHFRDDADKVIADENIALRGLVELLSSDKEADIRRKLSAAIQTRFPLCEGRDFIFLKATRRKLSVVVSADDFNYDFKQVKLLCGQGAIFLMLKPEYSFMLETTTLDDNDLEETPESTTVTGSRVGSNANIDTTPANEPPSSNEGHLGSTPSTALEQDLTSQHVDNGMTSPGGSIVDCDSKDTKNVEQLAKDCVNYCKEHEITDPIEILRQAQKMLVTGRKLDPTDETEFLEDETGFISIDRNNVLTTGLDEIKSLEDPRLTIEVSFYGERAQDYGGPRREFFATIIKEIYAKYFEKGWREHLANEYEVVGLIVSLSILQNGLLPRFFEGDMLKVTFKDYPAANECIKKF